MRKRLVLFVATLITLVLTLPVSEPAYGWGRYQITDSYYDTTTYGLVQVAQYSRDCQNNEDSWGETEMSGAPFKLTELIECSTFQPQPQQWYDMCYGGIPIDNPYWPAHC